MSQETAAASAPISPRRAVLTLGVTQTIGYGGSIYLPASLADPMAAGVGVTTAFVFAVFSGAMLIQAFVGPAAGRMVDRRGARTPLAAASVLMALGLAGLALSQNAAHLIGAWAAIGLGMAIGLYDIAFAGAVIWFGAEARKTITGITLIAGFASTVAWPLTAWLEAEIGWRGACLTWAAANALIALPLHLSLPRGVYVPPPPRTPKTRAPISPEVVLLATTFAVMSIMGAAISAHLPPLLVASGATLTAAIAAGVLIGPAQVAARLAEFFLVRHIHPLNSGRLSVALFPIGAVLLLLFGPLAAAPFAILYGAGNGLFTIVRGTLPLAMFGPEGYGARLGALMVPGRLLGALAPLGFALALERSVDLAVAGLAILGLAALACLLVLRRPVA